MLLKDPQRLGKGAGIVGNWRTSWDHPNYNIIKIGQNTEKSPGELRRLAVPQTPVKVHQLTLLWKTPRDINHESIPRPHAKDYPYKGVNGIII